VIASTYLRRLELASPPIIQRAIHEVASNPFDRGTSLGQDLCLDYESTSQVDYDAVNAA